MHAPRDIAHVAKHTLMSDRLSPINTSKEHLMCSLLLTFSNRVKVRAIASTTAKSNPKQLIQTLLPESRKQGGCP
jgi:hypothetical protein